MAGILTPDGLRVVCAGFDNDPEMIGIHMLEMLNKFRNEGIVELNGIRYSHNTN
jgi:hypothetical protein